MVWIDVLLLHWQTPEYNYALVSWYRYAMEGREEDLHRWQRPILLPRKAALVILIQCEWIK